MKLKKSGPSASDTPLCRQPKTSAVRSVRRKVTWNPHKYLVAAARRVWRWSPEKKAASELCALGKDKRKCAKCQQIFLRKLVHMDHIVPVGRQPQDWDDYPNYYRRMFCPASNIQGLCKSCHKKKTLVDLKEMHQQ
jgi:5-methylcytosine-specific restriction endonuclease McrA